MGIHLAVNCKNKENQEKMESFLATNFIPFNELIANNPKLTHIHIGAESYPPNQDESEKKLFLALKAPHGLESFYYTFRIMSWVSLKVGKLYKFKDTKLPVIFIDNEKYPIHLKENDFKSTPTNQGRKYVVDSVGWSPLFAEECMDPNKHTGEFNKLKLKMEKTFLLLKEFLSTKRTGEKEVARITKIELDRIEALWQQLFDIK